MRTSLYAYHFNEIEYKRNSMWNILQRTKFMHYRYKYYWQSFNIRLEFSYLRRREKRSCPLSFTPLLSRPSHIHFKFNCYFWKFKMARSGKSKESGFSLWGVLNHKVVSSIFRFNLNYEGYLRFPNIERES